MKAKTILILTLLFLAASSCTIEKQLYSRGFHVEFHKKQRPADSQNTTAIQPVTEIPEEEQITIASDSITEVPILQEKEAEVISLRTNEKIIRATKAITVKLKIKTTANRVRTGISIQTHFSESLMSKSLKENQKKYSTNRGRGFDWGEFAGWVLCIGGLVVLICVGAQAPGVTIGAILLGLLVVVVVIILVALLIASALGNIEWFWSGR